MLTSRYVFKVGVGGRYVYLQNCEIPSLQIFQDPPTLLRIGLWLANVDKNCLRLIIRIIIVPQYIYRIIKPVTILPAVNIVIQLVTGKYNGDRSATASAPKRPCTS